MLTTPARWGWAAWGALLVLASLALGLTRLVIGAAELQRLLRRSRIIDDLSLAEAIDLLRAEMSCLRKVQVRESAELVSPAAIGWRKPVILLPTDWRTWDEPERRAILSHELAHICRDDFAAGLVAQLSLSLHFYNPLAHWLASRVRLEQELAADAWGARLTGDRPSYLTTLARLALRQDSRAAWPARAFLPSRGTLARRIEMLRDTRFVRPDSLSTKVRVSTIATIAAAGLFVAGLRSPLATPAALAQSPRPAPASASAPDPAPPPAASGLVAAKADTSPFDLSKLPVDARLVVGIQPAALLRHPELKKLLDDLKDSEPFRTLFIVSPEVIQQVLVFWEQPIDNPGQPPLRSSLSRPSGFIIRTTQPQDWKTRVSSLIDSPEQTTHEGRSYIRSGRRPGELCGFAPDDRTLILASEDLIRLVIEDQDAQVSVTHPWKDIWNQVAEGDHRPQLVLAMETRWLRRRLAKSRVSDPGNPPPTLAGLSLEPLSPLFEKVQAYVMGVDFSQGMQVTVVAETGTESNAKSVVETAQAVLTLTRNSARSMNHDRRSDSAEANLGAERLQRWALEMLEKARLQPEGHVVRLTASADLKVADLVKFLTPGVIAARASAQRAVSMNNLKQIGLAFHNYHAQYDRFPSPTMFGGQSGKVPYSWRVALLPLLDQQELYNQYNFNEPWDGPTNRALLDKMPAVYAYPGLDGRPSSTTESAYFVLTGPGTALSTDSPTSGAGMAAEMGAGIVAGANAGENAPPARGATAPPAPTVPQLSLITDGTSNTLLVVEAKRAIPWTKPEDIPFAPDQPLPKLGGFALRGFDALFCDGSVRFIMDSIDENVLRALITRAGGEIISLDRMP
jgi:hypothetical protein